MSRQITAETFFHSQIETVVAQYPIHIYPGPLTTPEMTKQEGDFLTGNPHALTQEVFAAHFPQIIDSDALKEALNISGIHTYDVLGFDAIPVVQGGREGIISFIRVRTKTSEPIILVTHTSRHYLSSEQGKRLEKEYENLRDLSHIFDLRVPEHARREINVSCPLAYSEDLCIQGNIYGLMVSPFDPKGEIRVSGRMDEISPFSYPQDFFSNEPFFHYAVAYNSHMEKTNKVLLPKPNLQFLGNRRDHAEQILLQQALIYVATEGKTLKDFRINAGDLLGWFTAKKVVLTLTSIHDGYIFPADDDDWIEVITSHIEEYTLSTNIRNGVHSHFYVHPFPFERAEIDKVLQQARSILGKGKRNNFP